MKLKAHAAAAAAAFASLQPLLFDDQQDIQTHWAYNNADAANRQRQPTTPANERMSGLMSDSKLLHEEMACTMLLENIYMQGVDNINDM